MSLQSKKNELFLEMPNAACHSGARQGKHFSPQNDKTSHAVSEEECEVDNSDFIGDWFTIK